MSNHTTVSPAVNRKDSKKWPLAALTPQMPRGPETLADALNCLSAFAGRIATRYTTTPMDKTRMRLETLRETASWIVEKWPMKSGRVPPDEPPPAVPAIVRDAQIMLLDGATVTEE